MTNLTYKTIMAIALLFLSPNLTKAQKSFESAIEYMNFIEEQYKQITDDQWSYTSAVANDKSAKKIENKRLELLKTNKEAQSRISKMSGYGGNTSYRDSVVSFLQLNYNVLNEDYDKIVDMEEIAEQSYDLMEAYLLAQEQASEKINQASEMLSLVQGEFAKENDINMIEGELSKKSEKLAKANLVYKYYNKIYLIFFKCYKQEAYFLDALSKGDVSAMEQNKNALLEYAEEGIKTLKTEKPFGGDNTLKLACDDILKFYLKEANDGQVLIDFFLKKEKFEAISTAFEAKKKSKRTNTDIDQYNNAVNEYNNASNEYNTMNETLNKTRSKKIDNWNNTASKFTRKHI